MAIVYAMQTIPIIRYRLQKGADGLNARYNVSKGGKIAADCPSPQGTTKVFPSHRSHPILKQGEHHLIVRISDDWGLKM